MEMKKLIVLIAVSFLLSGCLPQKYFGEQSEQALIPTSTPIPPAVVSAELTLDFGGNNTATYSAIPAETVFDLLQTVAQKEELVIEIKQYDFGSLVESIDGYKNSADKSWIFYVNGQMADKAADKFELQKGDQVIWRYEKPSF